MRTRHFLAALVVLAGLVWPREASAQLDPISNLGACPASTGYDAAATSIVVATGCGASLPTAATNYGWCNATDYPYGCKDASGVSDPNYEVVRCTRSTDTLTCTRAQESTSASTKNTSAKTYWLTTLTAKTFTDVNTALGASFVTTATNSVLTNESVLTGTANQVIVTGATLSTPQDIGTASTPTFGGLTLSGGLTQTAASSSNIWSYYSADTAGPGALLRKGRGTSGTPLRTKDGDTIYTFNARGFLAVDDVTTATATANAAWFRAVATDDFTSTAQGTKVVIGATNDGATGSVDRLSVSGNAVTLESGVKLVMPSGGRIEAPDTVTLAPRVARTAIVNMRTGNITAGGPDPYGNTWGGTEQNQLALETYAQTDVSGTPSNYFDAAHFFGARDASSNTANGYSVLNEGNWTNAGGFTLNRFALWNFSVGSIGRTVFYTQSGSSMPAMEKQFLIVGSDSPSGNEGFGLRVHGFDVDGDDAPDGATTSLDARNYYRANTTTTRTWNLSSAVATLNFGGSNANKTVNVLKIDTTNTSTTGATVNLIEADYGGADRFRVSSAGNATLAGSITAVGAALGSDAIQTAEIQDDQVTYAKLQNVGANAVLARAAGTSGDVGEVSLSASTLLGRGSTGDIAALTVGKGLSISGTVVQGMEQSKTFSIENPGGAENFGGIRFNQAVTISKVVAVLQGSSTPSVTWQVRHGSDRSAAGADLFTANKTTTSTTTGAVETSTFNDATVQADHFVWLATTAQSGTVTAIHVTIFYTVD